MPIKERKLIVFLSSGRCTERQVIIATQKERFLKSHLPQFSVPLQVKSMPRRAGGKMSQFLSFHFALIKPDQP